MQDPGAKGVTFQHGPLEWTCRAANPHRVINGQYVHYQWRCTAASDRLVRYRWLAGE